MSAFPPNPRTSPDPGWDLADDVAEPPFVTARCEPCQATRRIIGDESARRAAVAAFVAEHVRGQGCRPHLVYAATELPTVTIAGSGVVPDHPEVVLPWV